MRTRCSACRNGIIDFDHKDSNLSRYISSWARIKSGKETRMCSKHQRNLTKALKRARFLALLPYTNQ